MSASLGSPSLGRELAMPESTRRLFPGYEPEDLAAHPAFVAERLLEEGETRDLRWLAVLLGGDVEEPDALLPRVSLEDDPESDGDDVAPAAQ